MINARDEFFLGNESQGETVESTAFIMGRETRALSSKPKGLELPTLEVRIFRPSRLTSQRPGSIGAERGRHSRLPNNGSALSTGQLNLLRKPPRLLTTSDAPATMWSRLIVDSYL